MSEDKNAAATPGNHGGDVLTPLMTRAIKHAADSKVKSEFERLHLSAVEQFKTKTAQAPKHLHCFGAFCRLDSIAKWVLLSLVGIQGAFPFSQREENLKPFKEAFCEHFQCPPERFVREAFTRSLYPHARPFAWWLGLGPERSLRLLEETGRTSSTGDLEDLINQYQYDVRVHGGIWERHWKFRVSGERLLELNAQIRKQSRPDNHALPAP